MEEKKKPLIILTGPTAVGKTALSLELAKAVNGSIVSADSMQVYKYMDIGSAKIRKEEMQGIKHYLIDELMPDEEFHVVRFKEMADRAMEEIWSEGKIPILTGGTGFYIQAVRNNIDFSESDANPSIREKYEVLAKEKGNEYLHEMLSEIDPASAKEIHANNVKRVIRALEFYEETGKPISVHNEEQKKKGSPYLDAYFVLNMPRNILYERIDRRVDLMMEEGLVSEVDKLKKMGYHREMVSMQGLGYKEILDYLDGKCTLEEAVYLVKRDTRHFAKRQITWFKRERDVNWIEFCGIPEKRREEEKQALSEILRILSEKGIIGMNCI